MGAAFVLWVVEEGPVVTTAEQSRTVTEWTVAVCLYQRQKLFLKMRKRWAQGGKLMFA
jgi:hypothetical protein